MNRDTVIGVVGAVILVVAMIGVFQYERSVGAAAGIGLTWVEDEAGGFDGGDTTALGQSSDLHVPINATGLTNVTFTLRWTATQGANTLSIAIEAPEGVAMEPITAEGSTGELTVTVPVANARPAGAQPGSLGVGDWHVTVHFVSATGVSPAGLPPVAQDQSVTWTLEGAYDAWAQATEA